ncbi:DUF4920 domain-containing protein [Salinimicrobium oceani]|nr:DUF4920 domain-containing protein [Salinimicrobium oceani]
MNALLLFCSFLITFSGIAQVDNSGESEMYTSVGEEFKIENLLSATQMQSRYENLKVGDTLQVTFKSDVVSVCKKKGCWMNVALEDGREVMVKFKDYAFFVPKDIENKEVIMEGKAYVTEMSVEDQRHYAEDAGKSPQEVTAITQPSVTLSFLAEGVKIKK